VRVTLSAPPDTGHLDTIGLDISAAAACTGLTVTALRWYEKAGLMLAPPARTPGGARRYGERDLAWLQLLTRLRRTGMPVRLISRYAELCRQGPGNEHERLALLRQHRDEVHQRLEQAQHDLTQIDHKIAIYEETFR
jgi:DNA-binding transcriptional MerR regulator